MTKTAIESSSKIITKLFQSFLVQVKIEVTTGQKVNLNVVFDDNVFDFKDRTTILAA